jgi:acyl-CoA synthetase (NDP forming)
MASTNAGFIEAILDGAEARGQAALSEYDSKRVLAAYGVAVTPEALVTDRSALADAARRIGYPVALKACSHTLPHKSDRGLVRLNVPDDDGLLRAASDLDEALGNMPIDGLLVQHMVSSKRELIIGGLRDPYFGPCVMLGLGGIAVEVLDDVAFRVAPLDDRDALEMLDELRARKIFDAFRGEPAIDREALCGILRGVGRLLIEHPRIAQVDINPLLIENGRPVAVDALLTLQAPGVQAPWELARSVELPEDWRKRLRSLFEPESVAIVGVSDSPLKWGFRILYNTLEGEYRGRLYGVNPKHDTVIGTPCYRSIALLPEAVDLAMIVVPPPAVPNALRECAAKGVRAVLIITAGFNEIDDAAAHALQDEIVAIAKETGLLVVGPNCAGLASPAPNRLYCGMIARFPGAGGLSIASQSGNIGGTALTWASLHQVGIGRFVSIGNAAVVHMEDYLAYFEEDEITQSVLVYIEGTRSGRDLFGTLRRLAARKPVVLVKGGRSAVGMRAAQSHTGSLATETRLFQAACRQAGVTVVDDTYMAMEVAGVFIHQPLPKGRRVAIISQGGGWGVITADACSDAGLDVIPLPDELRDELDNVLPEWWSRNNPVDLVASNDLTVLSRTVETVVRHPDVDAVILLGIGYIASARSHFQLSDRAVQLGLDKLTAMGAQIEMEGIKQIRQLVYTHDKPILIATDTRLFAYGPVPNDAILELERSGMYTFASPARVAQTLALLAERREFLDGAPRGRMKA